MFVLPFWKFLAYWNEEFHSTKQCEEILGALWITGGKGILFIPFSFASLLTCRAWTPKTENSYLPTSLCRTFFVHINISIQLSLACFYYSRRFLPKQRARLFITGTSTKTHQPFQRKYQQFAPKYSLPSHDWCVSVGWVSSRKAKDRRFNSWSGHRVRQPINVSLKKKKFLT